MAATLDSMLAMSLAPASLRILLPYAAVALTLAVTALYHRPLRARFGDVAGMWIYFSAFFGLFFAIPAAVILAVEPSPGAALASLGLGVGRWPLGTALVGAAIPITLLMSHFSSKMHEMQAQYPFSKAACAGDGAFVVYEASYLVLYYSAWEFFYRGLLFFPLLHSVGFLPAMALTTALSTLHHIGHPDTEIWSALAGGIIFSTITLLTDSILYAFAIHGMLGVFDDAFIYARYHRGRTPVRVAQ